LETAQNSKSERFGADQGSMSLLCFFSQLHTFHTAQQRVLDLAPNYEWFIDKSKAQNEMNRPRGVKG
jgi:hypothetical protein